MEQWDVPTIIDIDPDANVNTLLIERARATPTLPLFAVPEGAGWRDIDAASFQADVDALAKGLVASGIEPGDRIGMICRTRYEWTLIDFAVWAAGAVLVPIYETNSPTQIKWCLTDAEAVAVFVETAEHFTRVDEVRAEVPTVRTVWQIGLDDLDKLRSAGTEIDDSEIERRRSLARGDDTATLIYTAGTTGAPKGCVITHSNFVDLSRNAAAALPEVIADGASTLLFFTLAHVFARFISVLAVHAGVKVGHQADTAQLVPSLGTFRPTFLLAVPRVFEKVYNSAEQKAEAGGHGGLFRKAVDTAIEHSMLRGDGRPIPLGLRLRYGLYRALVYRKLTAAMGGRVRYAVSGSAPLGARLGHFFSGLGVEILEGYGLTETSAPATVNLPGRNKIGTVGPPLPGNGVRIADDGEIEVRGICVFQGYWNNPDATASSFDGEWFATGDLGSLDEDGYLTITGRAKELLVTAGGVNVAPAVLEDPIRAHPLVSQVVVVGDRRPFVSALLTLDAEMLPTWLQNNGVEASLSVEEAARNDTVHAALQEAIDAANAKVSRAESIRSFVVLPDDFTQDSGHLTPKLSIKRHAILNDYAETIDEIYSAPKPG